MSGGSKAWETRRARYGDSGMTERGMEAQREGMKKALAKTNAKATRKARAVVHATHAKASLPTINFKGPDDD
jgi:hypothetical protein